MVSYDSKIYTISTRLGLNTLRYTRPGAASALGSVVEDMVSDFEISCAGSTMSLDFSTFSLSIDYEDPNTLVLRASIEAKYE